ncbi:MAG: YheU family protein [Pseudohongiellaceae bacterium]|jgi:uncharacterized protein YheU (UPF0270 family)
MEIPHASLHPATLRNLVEEFVTREGTDYGQEFSLQSKVDQVLRQLREHSAVIVYDASSGTCSIQRAGGTARP